MLHGRGGRSTQAQRTRTGDGWPQPYLSAGRPSVSCTPPPDAEMSDTPFAVREGSLRSDHQHLYPGIQAGVWYIAASLTSAVGVGQERGSGRVLSDLHFEFKGGNEFGLRPADARTRTEDVVGR